jgi:energy-coupling factor transporter ATP-binding protein EcfA2
MAIDLITLAAPEVTKVVIKTVWEGGGKLSRWVGGGLNEATEQLIYDASKQYVRNYEERHGILKVLGMREPVNLETIYTTVQFLGQEGVRRFESIENLESAYRLEEHRQYQSEKSERQNGLKAANEQKFLMVLGAPGAGKSTFLKRMGLEALKGRKGQYRPECIPVFVELKRFVTGEVNLEVVIVDELETCRFPSAQKSVRKLLEQGKLLILLDGLDEVPTDQMAKAIGQIEDFVDKYKENRFIASCRTAAYHSSFRRFSDMEMSSFDDEQMEQFIFNWFQTQQDRQMGTAQRCWDLLQQPDYAATKELAQTPLLLTFLCLVFDDSQTFPKNRAVLYGEALDVLLKKWAAEKRIQRNPIYQDLTVALEEIMLAEIAYTNFSEDRLFFSQREVVEQIRTFLSSNLNAPRHLDGEQVLQAIQVQQGILIERARGVLSFSHLTLQEYLTARHITDNDSPNNPLIDQLIKEYLTDQRWRVVFILTAGLARGGSDQFLLLVAAEIQEFINTEKLKALVNWSERITENTEETLKPAAKRAVALFCVLDIERTFDRALDLAFDITYAFAPDRTLDRSTLDRAFDITRVFTSNRALDRALDRAFDRAFDITRTSALAELKIFHSVDFSQLIARLNNLKTQVPRVDEPKEVRRAVLKQIRQTWYTAFSFNPEWLNLSEEEKRSLEQYLYANELMVRCKEAALRVSPDVWNGIESRMLTVPDS